MNERRDVLLADNRTYEVRNGEFTGTLGPHRRPERTTQARREEEHQFLVQTARRTANATREGGIVIMSEEGYEHNTEDDFLRISGRNRDDFTLTTGNLVGRVNGKVGGNSYGLQISSRFGDQFLMHIIADADGFADMPHSGGDRSGALDWLIVYYWIVKLKKAFRAGLPKLYMSHVETTSAVRGRIDPLDYALNGSLGRYRCTVREHNYNNGVTQLVARTLQVLDKHALLRDSHAMSQAFQVATQGSSPALAELLRLEPVRNPYFMDYNPVIQLCKQILRNEYADFGDDSDSSALLFDMSMLFEYFIHKQLERSGFLVHSQDSFELRVPTGLPAGRTHGKLLPDLIFEAEGKTFLFDVKYKYFDFIYGVKREDLYQLHTYVARMSEQRPVDGCGFIYPLRESRWQQFGLDEHKGIFTSEIRYGSQPIPFHIAFLRVPDSSKDFTAHFEQSSKTFITNLTERLSVPH